MDFKKYIAESERSYNYRLKTIVALDDDVMDRIERIAMRYQPLSISRPRKTMLQSNPLDFTNISEFPVTEVWIVDLELGLPVSSYTLGEEIRRSMACHERYVIVRGANDPTEVESERLVAAREMGEEAADKELCPVGLITDPTYSEVEPMTGLYGKEHNDKFLGYLRTVEKERNERMKVDAPSPLFKWVDMPKEQLEDDAAFNADIPDAPGLGKAGPTSDGSDTAREGNLDDRKRTYRRQYGTKGKADVMMVRKVDTAKDPK